MLSIVVSLANIPFKSINYLKVSLDSIINFIKVANYCCNAQTSTKYRNIGAYKTSNQRIAATYGGDDSSYGAVTSNIELDTHADTFVAGANCLILHRTGRECDVSPYSDDYIPVTSVPIVTAATVWQSQYTGQEFLLIFNEALWMPSLPHTLINPNQLRAFGALVQDNPYSEDPLFIQFPDIQFHMELHTNGTVIFATSRTPT